MAIFILGFISGIFVLAILIKLIVLLDKAEKEYWKNNRASFIQLDKQ